MEIRIARPDDAPALAEVLALSWSEAYGALISPEILARNVDPAVRLRSIKTRFSLGVETFVLASADGRAAGMATLCPARDTECPGFGEIVAFYTRKADWGSGLAVQLMAFSLDCLQKQGFSQVLLWVLRDNGRARRFYEKCGFSADGAVKGCGFCDAAGQTEAVEVRYRLALPKKHAADQT